MPGLLLHILLPLIRRPLALLVFAVFGALVQPVATFAHAGGGPLIHVLADHIVPGQPFQLIAADLGQNVQVALELVAGGRKVSLGTVTTGADGHVEATLTLPESVPNGYVLLTATGDDGSFASTWVQVGEGSDLGPPPVSNPGASWIDPSLILIPIGAIALFLVWRFRGRA